MKQLSHIDFLKAAKILNVLIDPVASDDTGLGIGQLWFNTTSNFFKGYDGTNKFSLLRDDLAATITGVLTFNPSSGTVPFSVNGTHTSVVTNLNADRVDGYHAAEAATASTLGARDASGNLTVATPTSDGHAATKAYVDSIAAGQDWKDSCRVATTANITLSGTQTIDGVAVVADDRVLVKDQTTASQNGIYVCAAGAWSRASDADADAEVTSGLTTFVEEGTLNSGAGYTLTTSGAIVVGTTSLTFTKTSGGSVYGAGNGMVKSGTTFHFGKSASYTVGALPYANGASTIGFISAVASGKVLKSNGTGTVPLWAEVDLTADVTGTLPVGNGGTGTATQFTEGSVIFAGASGVYSQDNSGLFFNAATNRLGIGNPSPDAELHVLGSARITSSLAVGANVTPVAKVDVVGQSGGSGQGGSDGLGGVRARFSTGYGVSLDTWDSSVPRWGITRWSAHTPTVVIEGAHNSNQVRINHSILASSLASSSSDSVITENSGVLEKRTINAGAWGNQTAGRLLVSNGSGVIATDSGLIYDPGTGRTAFNRSAGIYSDASVTITVKDLAVASNITSNEMALYLEATVGNNIAAGVTDSGYRAGLVISAQVADLDFEGTLGAQYGLKLSHGATITTAGSEITNSYGVYIESNTTANTTITNLWGLYQANSTAKNYFAGNVGIGTTTPVGKVSILQTAGQGDIEFGNDGTGAFMQIYDRSTLAYKRLAFDADSYRFEVSNTVALTINNNGTLTAGVLNTGTGNSILTEESGVIKKRTIDSRVWGSSLVDGSGSSLRLAYWSDGDTLSYFNDLRVNADGQIFGGFGAATTTGTLDWNDSSNARPGNGYTLLQGVSTNGPSANHAAATHYFHSFSYEYNTKDATGNMTQFAIPYNGVHMLFRYRFSGTWTGWYNIWNSGNDGPGSGLHADLLDGQEGNYYLDLANSTGDTDDISEGLTNLFYTDARARAALSSTDSAEIAYNNTSGVIGLGTEAGRVKSSTIGDESSTSLTFSHNLGTRDVIVQVFRTGTPYDTILVDVARNTTNQVTIGPFTTAPTSGEFTVVCTAANG